MKYKDQNLNQSFFDGIADDIFKTGKSWGKIAVLLVLGAKVAWMAGSNLGVSKGEFILTVVGWVTSYILKNLLSWITESGGWVS